MTMPWGAIIGAGGSLLGGAMGGGLLGGSKGPQTSKWYRRQVKDLYGQASDIADRPFEEYTDPRFADFSPDQLGAMDSIRANLGLGSGAVNQAISGAQNAMGYSPQQVSAQYNPSAISASQVGANYNPALITAQQLGGSYNYNPQQVGAGSVSAQQIQDRAFTDYDINQYMNPYTQQVIDTSLGDLERSRQEVENAQKGDMLASGAWGGSRSGVAQSLTNREFGNTAASTAANLRNQGFLNASNLIMQDANRNLAGQQSNQAAALAAAQSNASLGLQTQLANQTAGMNNAQFGANYGLNLGLANQDANLRAQLANASNQQFGAQLGLNADLANQSANMQAQMANLQSSQFGANLGLNAQMANQSAGLQGNAQNLAGASLMGSLGSQQQNMANIDSQNLMGIGNMQQAQAQQPLDFAYQQYLMGQGWDQNQMNFLRGFLTDPKGVAQGGMSQPSQGLGILGGAMTGMNMANSIYDAWNQSRPQTGYQGLNLSNYQVPNQPIPQDFSWLGAGPGG